MSSVSSSPLEKFQEDFRNLVDEITDMIGIANGMGYPGISMPLLNVTAGIIKNASGVFMLKTYIERSSGNWSELADENEEFFETHMLDIFRSPLVSDDILTKFKGIHRQTNEDGERYLEEADVIIIWDYLHALTKITFKWLQTGDNLTKANRWLTTNKNPKPPIDLEAIMAHYAATEETRKETRLSLLKEGLLDEDYRI